MCATVDIPGRDAGELPFDRIHEIDRCRPPSGLTDVVFETLGYLGADLETAGPDPGADLGSDRIVAGKTHLIPQGGDHPGVRAPPSGMGHTDGGVRVEDDAEAICGEHRKGETARSGPEGIGRTGVPRCPDPHDSPPMDLTDGCPLIRHSEGPGRTCPGGNVTAEIAVRRFAEGNPVP